MKLLALYILALCNFCFATVHAQKVSLDVTNAPFQKVALSIQQQTGYSFSISKRYSDISKPVTMKLKDTDLKIVLDQLFKDQPFSYAIDGKIISLIARPKGKPVGSKENPEQMLQETIRGRVTDSLGSPLAGVTVRVVDKNIATTTDSNGRFELKGASQNDLVSLQLMGYKPKTVVAGEENISVSLAVAFGEIQDVNVVVNTGFQSIPKERATGSFATVDNELFNQQVGTDVLSRIPNVANSVMMDQSRQSGQIMVRGLSTISGPKDPLIILDNFPYEGDLNNINPNIVENITILKDASASSIWGARAANGVIVITTKKGSFNRPTTFDFNSNLTIGAKPDLSYIRQMSASDYIDVEQELFSRGFYRSRLTSRNRLVVSPVVDYLDQVSKGLLTEQDATQLIDGLRDVDVRDQLDRYMYSPAVRQQYFLSAQGGSDKFSWLSAVGYDRNKETLGEVYDRINVRFQNTYKPVDNLSITTNLYYTQSSNSSGRIGYSGINPLFPYTRIADENGDPLPIPKNFNQSYLTSIDDGRLLDWKYYPLSDWEHQTSRTATSNLLSNIKLEYKIINGLTASVDYQYERQNVNSTQLANEDSYMARDYINRFSQITNGQVIYIVPKGGIMDKVANIMNTNNLRGQLSFDKNFGRHNINAIIGAEMRSTKVEGNNARYYGYNSNNLTTGLVDFTRQYPNLISGANQTILNANSLRETDTRYISQYANAAYTYDDRYILSGSLRRDGSNLFGLKTNDQWNPFWSGGLAWKVSNEDFYNSELLPYLNIRATYGFSGNIDPAMVAVNTIRYASNSVYSGTPVALFNNFYNPELQWETSKMINIGVDFKSRNNRLSGSVEYYLKRGIDLFGVSQIDYTTGVSPSMLRNVASMRGNGIDLDLKSENLRSAFKWNTTLNFSYYKDEIVEYNVNRNLAALYISPGPPPISGVEGHAVYAMYGFKWAGLDPATGEAQGYLAGEISKDYINILGEGTSINELDYFGSAIPTKFGSLINSLSYSQISLDIGITYKFGYWFRRNSINYSELFNNWRGHSDYEQRWQNPGDELNTDVPAISYQANSSRDQFYEGASILVERGDHIRLQYVNLSYTIPSIRNIKNLQVYFNANNLGILWRANDHDIDPDFNLSFTGYVNPSNYALGVRARF